MKRITILMMTMLLGAVSLCARPAYSKPVDVRQPDGTTVTLLMRGDEFLSFTTTVDGYTVVKGDDGFYRYAEKDGDGLKASAFVARNATERTAAEQAFLQGRQKMVHAEMSEAGRQFKEQASRMYSAAYHEQAGGARRSITPGAISERIDYSNFKGLVVLVNWNDREFHINEPKQFYQKLTSQKNYTDNSRTIYPYDVKGSLRDYFYDNSMGMFDPTFDVVGPVTINYSCEYPWPKDANGNITSWYDDRMNNILKAVMTEVNKTVDFRNYDLNNDGNIDMVYLIFAGYGSYVQGNNIKYIWPHANDYSTKVYSSGNYTWADYYGLTGYDGKKFGRYACSVEIQDQEALASQHQYADGIGTMCHEFSHVLGLADHYDTDYSESTVTPGDYDLMDSGTNFNQGLSPVGYSAFERKILGFADNTITTLEAAGDYQLEPLNTSNTAYIVKTAKNGEVFYVENRQKTGWDECLPGKGLLVWRINTSNPSLFISNTANNTAGAECVQVLGNKPITSLDLTADNNEVWAKKGAVIDLYDITENDGVITFTAGTDGYATIVEDFEGIPLTEGDATGLQGKFCQWNLENAKIVSAGDYGNGSHVLQIGPSGTVATSKLGKGIRNLKFTLQNGNAVSLRFTVKKSTDGTNWTSVIPTKNVGAGKSIDCQADNIPAGNYLQIHVITSNSSAAAYIDDIEVTQPKGTDGISATLNDKGQMTNPHVYDLQGRKVANPTKGLYIVNGKLVVIK